LNKANHILLVVTPEMASLRAAVGALNIYERLGFPDEKIHMVLNHNVNATGIRQPQLEKALGRRIDTVIPYEPNEVIRAINFGEPFFLKDPDLSISVAIENLAFNLSHEIHKNIPPAVPTNTWKRVTARMAQHK
jgi:Flp pilus assembly CpaE family ATPase